MRSGRRYSFLKDVCERHRKDTVKIVFKGRFMEHSLKKGTAIIKSLGYSISIFTTLIVIPQTPFAVKLPAERYDTPAFSSDRYYPIRKPTFRIAADP